MKVEVIFKSLDRKFPHTMSYIVEAETKEAALACVVPACRRENPFTPYKVKKIIIR